MGEHTQPVPNHGQAEPMDRNSEAPQQLSASEPDRLSPPPWYGYAPPVNDVRSDGYPPSVATPQSGAGTQPTGAQPHPSGTIWGSAPAAAWPGAGGPSDPGAPSATVRKSKPWKKVAGGLAVAAVIAGGGVAAVSAANASSNSTQTAPGGFDGNGNGMAANGYGPAAGGSGMGMPGARGGVSALNNALHGEFVVQTQDGGTQTERLQSGEVTALSGDSLLVTSSDGFTATYVLPADLDVSSIAAGDPVLVVATVTGDTVTATSVQSGTLSAQGAQSQGGGGMPGGAGVPDGTIPSGTASTGAPAAPQTS
jgi:hypothetical protein